MHTEDLIYLGMGENDTLQFPLVAFFSILLDSLSSLDFCFIKCHMYDTLKICASLYFPDSSEKQEHVSKERRSIS